MKLIAITTAALVVLPQCSGFIASSSAAGLRCKVRSRLCMSSTETSESPSQEGEVYVVGEITEDNQKNKFVETFLDTGVVFQPKIPNKSDGRSGPADYTGLIDGDSFDGGDGQVGCVGDGKNQMEEFDVSEVVKQSQQVRGEVMVKESKARQMNAWGSNSGYAEELAEKGMKKVNEYGEDKMAVRRQQFENYRNQQELQKQQRAKIQQLESMTGLDAGGSSWKRGGGKSYMDVLASGAGVAEVEDAWNTFKAPVAGARSDGAAWQEVKVTGNEKITDTVMCVSSSGRPGTKVIQVKNSVMTFEPFHCEFVGNAEGFNVEPKTGTLNRRNGDAIPLTVSFKANGPGDQRDATLVIETEEDKWVYRIEGRTN